MCSTDLLRDAHRQGDRLKYLCGTEIARSAALRQSILKDAFAGRLVPQDPADEPATALLARVKDAGTATPKRTSRTSPTKVAS